MKYLALVVSLSFSLACGDDDDASDGIPGVDAGADAQSVDGGPSADAGPPPLVFGGDRPTTIRVPSSYDPAVPMPLVVALHGYYTSANYVSGLFGLDSGFESEGFLLIAPSGTKDPSGNYWWNATDACCWHQADT